MSSDALVRSDRQTSLSPLALGLTSIFGPVGMVYGQHGMAFASDVMARLVWMIVERLLRSLHELAMRYLQEWKELRSEGIRERLENAFRGRRGGEDESAKQSVSEAVNGGHLCKMLGR